MAKPLRDWTRDLAADADFFFLRPTQPSSTQPTPAQVVNWNLADANFFFHKAGATQLHSAQVANWNVPIKKMVQAEGFEPRTLEQTPQQLTTRQRTLLCLLSHFKYFVYLTIDPSIFWTLYTLIFAKSNLTFISTLNIHKTILWQFPEFLEKF